MSTLLRFEMPRPWYYIAHVTLPSWVEGDAEEPFKLIKQTGMARYPPSLFSNNVPEFGKDHP